MKILPYLHKYILSTKKKILEKIPINYTMLLETKSIAQSLSPAYRKTHLTRIQMDRFKGNLSELFANCEHAEAQNQTEEHFKSIAAKMLSKTYFDGVCYVNANKRKDLAIHHEKEADSPIGVIIETKRPSNKAEMISLSKPNVKALHELLHYYLEERLAGNKEVKHLIVTNIYEWYIFDGSDFKRLFFDNPKLQQDYKAWHGGRLGVKKTDWLYQEVLKPFLEQEQINLTCTYFDLQTIKGLATANNSETDRKLIDWYKIFSAEHLLKKPFANDSNTLNREFYDELLYVLGLEEVKDSGKKIIVRKSPKDRHEGSLLENTINMMLQHAKIAKSKECCTRIAIESEEELFSNALELCITWLNRVLFLKLLEGQLRQYHKGDMTYSFMNSEKIRDFDELNELFFEVLAATHEERSQAVKEKFGQLPYLNSTLFETTDLEYRLFTIAMLKDRLAMPLYSQTVLKDDNGKRISGSKNTLQYLFAFLDAYDFASDSAAEIQEQNKTLINAAVLGLIFEKINGYQDGSFFTPGYITMYMCHETIRRAARQKFNEKYGWQCKNFTELYNKVARLDLVEANRVVNNLKICDPAVGSGHFLVSALNELISLKKDLDILIDKNGRILKGYDIALENDELVVSHYGEVFEYNYMDRESQRVQETLFHEKQTLIENCLFGVDINPKSVMICRLRLWIELLKNMYYKDHKRAQLETLPNIDINIKVGNSLVSRFELDDKYSHLTPSTKQKLRLATQQYKEQVIIYKSTQDKDAKSFAEKRIAQLKETFAQIANPTDEYYRLLKAAEAKLGEKPLLFGKEDLEEWLTKTEQMTQEVAALKAKYEQKLKTLYRNGFEWRFEFPEVLDDDGNFVGFDVVVGNPPYIRHEKITAILKNFYQKQFPAVANGSADIYVYFFNLSLYLCKKEGDISFITLNKWLKTKYGVNLRNTLLGLDVHKIVDFFELPVFEQASTDSAITIFQNRPNATHTKYFPIKTLEKLNLYEITTSGNFLSVDKQESEWTFSSESANTIMAKIQQDTIPLLTFVEGKMYMGIKTGCNEAFIIDDKTKNELTNKEPHSIEIIKRYAEPTEFSTYKICGQPQWFINSHNGILITVKNWHENKIIVNEKLYYPISGNLVEIFRVEEVGKSKVRVNRIDVECDYPTIYEYLANFRDKLETRGDKGVHWTNLRSCDYIYEFNKNKIIYVYTAKKHPFYFDTEGMFINNSSYMIVTESKYLWTFLNSKLFMWLMKIKFVAYGDADEAGRVKLDSNKMEMIPIKQISSQQEEDFNQKVTFLFEMKHLDINEDSSIYENELNQLIYTLYNLTKTEITIIENATK